MVAANKSKRGKPKNEIEVTSYGNGVGLACCFPHSFAVQSSTADETEEWKKATDAATHFLSECLRKQTMVQIQAGIEPMSFFRLMPQLCKKQYDLFSQAFIGRARHLGFSDEVIKGKLSATLTDITSGAGALYSEWYEKKKQLVFA